MGELDRRTQVQRKIGSSHPIFLIAEVGTTANGDLETALQLIDAAKEAGADAVKFQMINPDELMSDKTVTYEYEVMGGKQTDNMYEMFKKLMFKPREWAKIAGHAEKAMIGWFTSVDNIPDIALAERLDCPAYKISSWDLRNYPLIRAVARTGKSVMVDLGPAIMGEVAQLVATITAEGNENINLFHCSHAQEVTGFNLRTIPYLQKMFRIPIGYSADNRNPGPDIMAVGLGVNLIEKRLSLNIEYPGHHHIKALNPSEFKDWVQRIRTAEAMLGEFDIKPSLEDLRMKGQYFTSIVFSRDVEAGEVITGDMLAARRPGSGISPFYMDRFIGRKLARDFKENEVLPWDAV